MFKKTSKYLIFSSVLLVFSLLLVSCQSLIASTEEMDEKQVENPLGANFTIPGEIYFEEYKQERHPPEELKAVVPTEAVVMVDASSPGIEIQRTMTPRTLETVYTVMSDGPGWVVLHADKDGVPGAILEQIWVDSGTNRIARSEGLEEMSSEPIHVMLHHDLGWTGYFEFPRTDGPVFVDNEMVNELCLCSY